ncbi:hypothetical protein F4778DRAFT_714118 [Xylariomycetidae sp. FL2044]|nr:hypothetical protein F4778DRAFT_714118 [Xylariomycetidae sp. FL2044]
MVNSIYLSHLRFTLTEKPESLSSKSHLFCVKTPIGMALEKDPTLVEEDTSTKLPVVIEFSGGLEMLFSDQKRHSLSIPAVNKTGKPFTIADLIAYLCDHTMKDTRKELFVLDHHLRPGILVLINDADWELEGEEAYEIQSGDNILFVSTLHGG